MKFTEALQLIESNKDILGTTTDKGLLIELILIVPTEQRNQKQFINSLNLSHNPQQSILPFTNDDVEVWATNADYLYKKNILFFQVLKPE